MLIFKTLSIFLPQQSNNNPWKIDTPEHGQRGQFHNFLNEACVHLPFMATALRPDWRKG